MVSVSLCLYSSLSILTLFQSRNNNLLGVSDVTSFTHDSRYDHAMFISPGIVNIKNKCIDAGKCGVSDADPEAMHLLQHP